MRGWVSLILPTLAAVLAGGAAPAGKFELREVPGNSDSLPSYWDSRASRTDGVVKPIRTLTMSYPGKSPDAAIEQTHVYDCGWGQTWTEGDAQVYDDNGKLIKTSPQRYRTTPYPVRGAAVAFKFFCDGAFRKPARSIPNLRQAIAEGREAMQTRDLKFPPPILISEGPLPDVAGVKVWTLANDRSGRRAMLMFWEPRPNLGKDDYVVFLANFGEDGPVEKLSAHVYISQAAFDCARGSIAIKHVWPWHERRGELWQYPREDMNLSWTPPKTGPLADAMRLVCTGETERDSDFATLGEALTSYRAAWTKP